MHRVRKSSPGWQVGAGEQDQVGLEVGYIPVGLESSRI